MAYTAYSIMMMFYVYYFLSFITIIAITVFSWCCLPLANKRVQYSRNRIKNSHLIRIISLTKNVE